MNMLAVGRERAGWAPNLQTNQRVTVELGNENHVGATQVLQPGTSDDQPAREMLVSKYQQGEDLDARGRNSLPVVIEFSAEGDASTGAKSVSR